MYLKANTLRNKFIIQDKLDVTDPGYDKDVWCRMTLKDMLPGEYSCHYYTGLDFSKEEIEQIKKDYKEFKLNNQTEAEYIKMEKHDIRGRCFVISVMHKDHFNKIPIPPNDKRWEEIGTIGVDAGMAGFFPDKPDFNEAEWSALCEMTYESKKPAYFKKGLGFWASSGYGDGVYAVSVIKENDKTIAVQIEF